MTGTTQIEAGRELDALIAREVMGYDIRPSFSTTGDGMLAVLERMRQLGWWVNIHGAPDGGRVSASFTGAEFGRAIADTIPHAVCLAALEAVRA